MSDARAEEEEVAGVDMGPLAGYRVLEFTSAVAGPVAGQILADMGAEVIKVESRVRLDGQRLGRPPVSKELAGEDRARWVDLMPVFHVLNRNKLSATINVQDPEGLSLVKKLVEKCDAVIDNFASGVMERLGLGYDALKEVKPDIVVVSMPGPGSWGPFRDMITYAGTIGALSGWDSLTGYEDGDVLGGGVNPDAIGAVHGCLAVLMALHYRNRTGKGQHVEMPEWEAAVSLLGEAVMAYGMNSEVYSPRGNAHPTMAPHGNYPCLGEDEWVAIAVRTDQEWRSLCRALGDPAWARDGRFAHTAGRVRHLRALDVRLGEWTRTRGAKEVVERLQKAGVAATPVLTVAQQAEDPHQSEREVYVEVQHPILGRELMYNTPIKLSRTPGSVRRSGPLLGEHNDYVLRELLQLAPEDVDRLTAAGVIG